MLIMKRKGFVFALLTIFLFSGLTFIEQSYAQPNRGNLKKAELRKCIREFRKLLREKKNIVSAENIDLAKELDRKSQKAARAGRTPEALSLLKDAIGILKKNPGESINEPKPHKQTPGSARDIAKRILSADDELLVVENSRAMDYFDSPFGFIDDVAQEPYLGELNVHWRRGTKAGRWGWI
jgi:hypothetical protein